MKTEQKQSLRSSGVLSLFGLLVAITAIIGTPWNRQIKSSDIDVARQKAEVLGYQVAQIYREATIQKEGQAINAQGRRPASESFRSTGTMGTDPWGEPYYYRIIQIGKADTIRVLVWSSGPNKKVETTVLQDEDATVKNQPIYLGDDMGVLLSVAQK